MIAKFHEPIYEGIDLLSKSSVNSMFILGEGGTGKSYSVDKALESIDKEYVVFSGYMSEPKFFEYIRDNSDKIIVLRDFSALFKNKAFIDFLKSATEIAPKRIISRMVSTKASEECPTIEFTGKLIVEANNIPNKYKSDLDAIKSRALNIEINPSPDELKTLMRSICKNDLQKSATEYLLSKDLVYKNLMNLRTQAILFEMLSIYPDWEARFDRYLDTQVQEGTKLLYRYCGDGQVKRIEFVRYLMHIFNISYATAQNRVDKYLFLNHFKSNGLKKQALLSIREFT